MGLKGSRGVPEETDPVQLPRLLPLSGERRKNEDESENDREPDQSHAGVYAALEGQSGVVPPDFQTLAKKRAGAPSVPAIL